MIPQLQTNNRTFYGRHLTEARVLRRYFPSDRDLSVLSFGCATGEELLLLRTLFPAARLFGCEHDWSGQQAARALLGNSAIVFDSTPEQLRRHGPYDVIVCNSVLLAPTVKAADGLRALAPGVWRDTVALLDEVLAPGGILQLINSNYPLRLHPVASSFTPLRSPLLLGANFVDVFALDGRRLCAGVPGTGSSPLLNVHFGEAGWDELAPEDFTDTHFQKAGGTPAVAIADEVLPNLRRHPAKASGSCRFEATPPDDPRPATFQTVELAWSSVGADAVRIRRTATRTWFDGARLPPSEAVIDLQGPAAGAFFESMLGRGSTRIALSLLAQRGVTESPLF